MTLFLIGFAVLGLLMFFFSVLLVLVGWVTATCVEGDDADVSKMRL